MDILDDLVCLNCDCFKVFEVELLVDWVKFVVLVFDGDIYKGFEVKILDFDDLNWV